MINIPNYHVLEPVYQSKKTLIYKAYDKVSSVPVYLKLLNSQYPSNDQIAQFYHEFEITKKLHDTLPDMIISIKEIIKVQNTYGLILEDFGAASLGSYLNNRSFSIEKFLELAIQITKILGHIHNENLIHKDINPSNILWNEKTNQMKIIDFGIATWLVIENIEESNVHNIEGTLAYLSPEQTGRMNRMVDYRADYYALGVTFYEMLTRHVPFNHSDPVEIVHAHMAKVPVAPKEIDPNIPDELSNIVLKLLSKTPEDRYQSSHGLIEDLYQCQLEWLKHKYIHPFSLGSKDISPTFQLSKKLYGRNKELHILTRSFERSIYRIPEFTLVTGDPGVGKSALIHEILKSVTIQNGYFIHGKCDQYKRNIPYDSLVKALKVLIQVILSEDAASILAWKKKIMDAVGTNCSILVSLIPELKHIVGVQPPIVDLTISESENRLNFALLQFIQALSNPKRSLTIFLDDLQWVDSPTLNLISHLLNHKETKHLYLVGAYRASEINETHPLSIALHNLKKEGMIVNLIELFPLQVEDIEHMLSDLLKNKNQSVKQLSQICFLKTQGNPFFLNQLLFSLQRKKLIYFDRLAGKWLWNLDLIKEEDISPNVIEFMAKKISELPFDTKELLKTASCIGNKFDLKTLAEIAKQSLHQTSNDLWPALFEGLIIPEQSNYKLISSQTTFSTTYRFLHDHVQQAVYSLIAEKQKQEYHYKIGRYFLSEEIENSVEDRIFEVVNQLNLAIDLMEDAEKNQLVTLNALAGKKAKSYSAFKSASDYFEVCRKLLPENSWDLQYASTLEILKEWSECLYILGDKTKAEKNINEILEHAKTNVEKASVLSLRSVLYTTHGKYEEAMEVALQGLALLGVPISQNPPKWQIIKEFILSKWYLGSRNIASLIHMPSLENEKEKITLSLLQECSAPAFIMGKKNLMGILMLKQINLTLSEGNNIWAPTAYITHAITLNIAGEYKSAFEFGKLSLAMMEKGIEYQHYKARNLVTYAIMIHGWNAHFKTLKTYYMQAVQSALQTGDFLNALYAHCHSLDFDPEITVETVLEDGAKHLNLLKTRNQNQWDSNKTRFSYYANLRGETKSQFSLSTDDFDEYEALARMEKMNFTAGLATYHYTKAIIYFMYEDYPAALESSLNADRYMESLTSSLFELDYKFHRFFIHSAAFSHLPENKKETSWQIMKNDLARMKKWAKHCPINFLHYQYLMEAETARLQKKVDKAQVLYDLAIQQAKQNDYIRAEALANELAAKFYLQIGKEKIAKVYFQEAHYHYQKWGAIAKALHLEQTYIASFQQRFFSVNDKTIEHTESSTYHSLDIFSALKATQLITREIHFPKLIEKMMRVVTENAGAQKGMLLLNRNGKYYVEALIDVDRVEMHTSFSKQDFPNTIIEKVIRTKSPILIDDATDNREFKKDPYIIFFQPKSVLCFPLLNLGEIKGVLYLENNLATNIFKQDQMDIINLLSTQIAISIDNAEFYKKLEEKVSERTKELKETQDLLYQKEKMAYLGVLMTGIAHEIENPLNFVINFSHFAFETVHELQTAVNENPHVPIKDLNLIPESLNSLKESAQAIFEQGKKADMIVKRMIEHSVSTNQSFVYIDINTFLEQVINIALHRLETRYPNLDVKIVKEFHPFIQYIQIVEEDLQRVMINLLDNSYQALLLKVPLEDSHFEPTILVKTQLVDNFFEIIIHDNGIGIDEVYHEKLFTPFFTANFKQGVGLGLSLCRNIIEKEHQGVLTFSTQKGVYTQFIIKLPIEANHTIA